MVRAREVEGVVKFRAEHIQRALSTPRYGEVAHRLIAWREVLSKLQLVGQDPSLYDGAGYGNVSARVGPRAAVHGARPLLITGTQTGGLGRIDISHLCLVERYDYEHNWVKSEGLTKPSSETMTHGAIYDLSPAIRFVYHAHSPVLWRSVGELRIPTTHPQVLYGTPDMAREVQQLYSSSTLPSTRILAMGGHEDGIMVFGETAEQAGQVLVTQLARAFELACVTR
jgi:ribulose-5-phosphate 4-epimerase/fuculose-1-phosphate aldolase